ncbi:hypothetical protein LTR37_003427 [Vermiconidia calcicola]|uniref:Uncharacterized protein n=1 Tax=Vermiconidia calcicola TaxID=1690605 RepID=A0ACC3NS16_9PEZI|nr:hypothetical protein LTR37_003427 [Vermiconidia calcicola]
MFPGSDICGSSTLTHNAQQIWMSGAGGHGSLSKDYLLKAHLEPQELAVDLWRLHLWMVSERSAGRGRIVPLAIPTNSFSKN